MRIEEAVDDDIDIENWDYSNSDDPDICDLILTTDGGDLMAVRAIRKKFQKSISSSPKAAIASLNILENCVRNCGKDFIVHVCQKDYIEDLVYIATSEVSDTNESVRTKLLALVQSWAFEFSSDRELRGIAEVYMRLKDEGMDFPAPSEDDLKEADSEDIEAFFNAHEDDDGPVLEVLESLMVEEKEEGEGEEPPETTEMFNKFLEKRVVKVEIEALREELKREVELLPEEVDDISEIPEDEEEAIIADLECELGIGHQGDSDDDVRNDNTEEVGSDEFRQFLVKRAVAVENGNLPE